jgi:cyanate permease
MGPWAAGGLFDATGSYAAAVVGAGLLALASSGAAWQAIRTR